MADLRPSSRTSPVNTQVIPTTITLQPRGTRPLLPSGVPKFPSGVPKFPSGVPKFPSGVPKLPSGVPKQTAAPPVLVTPLLSARPPPVIPGDIRRTAEGEFILPDPELAEQERIQREARLQEVGRQFLSILPESESNVLTYEFAESQLGLMPLRCYTCARVLRQQAIELALQEGRTLKQVMDDLGYRKICCRMLITGAPGIVELQKQVQTNTNVVQRIQSLTLGETGALDQPREIEEVRSRVEIIDEAPPGLQQTGICFTGINDNFLEEQEAPKDAYQFSVEELGYEPDYI